MCQLTTPNQITELVQTTPTFKHKDKLVKLKTRTASFMR